MRRGLEDVLADISGPMHSDVVADRQGVRRGEASFMRIASARWKIEKARLCRRVRRAASCNSLHSTGSGETRWSGVAIVGDGPTSEWRHSPTNANNFAFFGSAMCSLPVGRADLIQLTVAAGCTTRQKGPERPPPANEPGRLGSAVLHEPPRSPARAHRAWCSGGEILPTSFSSPPFLTPRRRITR